MLILAHGGAGLKTPSKEALQKLKEAIGIGYEALKAGGTALQAVIETIAVLEDSALFNAGSGGNLQLDGVRRLDASLMEGSTLLSGSVIGLEGIKNPVKAALLVMESPHRIMTNIGAKRLAEARGLEGIGEPGKKVLERLAKAKAQKDGPVKFYNDYFSTVGAVALDKNGAVASGSSTGGVSAMFPGRVGDTPVIGAGIYANRSGAVSCTGKGEDIIRLSLAKEVSMRMDEGMSPHMASMRSLKRILKIEGEAGLIVLDRKGKFAIAHTTERMASGYADKKGVVVKEGFKRIG